VQKHPQPQETPKTTAHASPLSPTLPETSVHPSRLRHNPVHAAELTRSRAAGLHRTLREHQPRAAKYRTGVILLLVRRLSRFALLVVPLQCIDRGSLLGHEVDHEGHGKVGEAVAP